MMIFLYDKIRGVFSSLVEKHFPAPNMERIAKLIGFDYSQNNLVDNDRKRKRGIKDEFYLI